MRSRSAPYIRAGKRMPLTSCEVVATLKWPLLAVFDAITRHQASCLGFRLSPEVTIARGARVKRAGEQMRGEAVEQVARHQSPEDELPYQCLPGEALRGDPSLFTSDACVEAAWAVADPVLDNADRVHACAPCSWGPEAASAMTASHGGWHDPKAEGAPA